MLDSGESDHNRIEIDHDGESAFLKGKGTTLENIEHREQPMFRWSENQNRQRLLDGLLKPDRGRVSQHQGVFVKCHDHKVGDFVGFFINTNKTADIDKEWHHRGYHIRWQHNSLHRWLVKLRNWQEKYNPIERPVLWSDLEVKHLGHDKTDFQLAEAAPTCFLFRDASMIGRSTDGDSARPITSAKIEALWGKLLIELEKRENAVGSATANGTPLRFIKIKIPRNNRILTYYPLHALRVSLITALADGGLPLEMLMKLAGHTRLVMTIYYRKLNVFVINEAIRKANEKLTKNADELLVATLIGKRYEDLQGVVVGDEAAMLLALPRDPKDRNAAGFERELGGWCLMGGNTTPHLENKQLGGCFNGGRLLKDNVDKCSRVYAPVRSKACIECNCRWFVSRPEYILEIKARMDLLVTNLSGAQRRYETTASDSENLRREKLHAAQDQKPFNHASELEIANRIHERAAAEVDFIGLAIANGARLIDRVLEIALIGEEHNGGVGKLQLVAQGDLDDVRQAVAGVSNDLLVSSGISGEAEIYPNLQRNSNTSQKWGFEPASTLLQLLRFH